MARWIDASHTVQELGDIPQICFKRPGLRIFLDQRPERGTLCRSIDTIHLLMDELDLLPVQHGLTALLPAVRPSTVPVP